MKEELLSLVGTLKSDRRLASFDEAATKQVVVLRFLSLLGWDIYNIDEVKPEHPVMSTKVDYLLKNANKSEVFIEVKRVGEPLEETSGTIVELFVQRGRSPRRINQWGHLVVLFATA